jgi:Holliday junction resolvase RusA-like endonuclease
MDFTVYDVPIAQPRQKHARLPNGMPVNYVPKNHKIHEYKASIKHEFTKSFPDHKPIEGPIFLSITFILPRPKNMIWKRKEMPREWHTKKPDLDNLEKAVKDSLNKLAWRDDSQVCNVRKVKMIANGEECPATRIIITQGNF